MAYLIFVLTFQPRFSDGTEKYLFANGEEHTLFTDGTLSKIDPNQVKTVEYANGDKVMRVLIYDSTIRKP